MYVCMYACMYLCMYVCTSQYFFGTLKIGDFCTFTFLLIIKIAGGLETLFLRPRGTPLPITHIFWVKVCHFSCTKLNNLR